MPPRTVEHGGHLSNVQENRFHLRFLYGSRKPRAAKQAAARGVMDWQRKAAQTRPTLSAQTLNAPRRLNYHSATRSLPLPPVAWVLDHRQVCGRDYEPGCLFGFP